MRAKANCINPQHHNMTTSSKGNISQAAHQFHYPLPILEIGANYVSEELENLLEFCRKDKNNYGNTFSGI